MCGCVAAGVWCCEIPGHDRLGAGGQSWQIRHCDRGGGVHSKPVACGLVSCYVSMISSIRDC